MQQSKAVYFLISILNFIVQKTKLLKITSNFRISLDLFELVNFVMNYSLQMIDKTITGYTKVALRHFVPFPAKRHLEMIDTLVFLVRTLLSNMPQAQYTNGLRS